MKLVDFVEIHSDLLKTLREKGIRLRDVELTAMYREYMAMRRLPNSKHTEVLEEVCRRYGIGHTKAWEVINTLDRDL